MTRQWRRVAAALALCIALAVGGTARAAEETLIFAAASLKNAVDEIAAQYKAATGKIMIASYAASSALAKQIEEGAPADIFISADLDWMDYLAGNDLIQADTRANLLGNRLVLIAPADSTVETAIHAGFPLASLLEGGRLAMADTKAVPAGKYGKAALESLGVWPTVEDKLAEAENVRAALALVSTGEAPLGIVYQSDAVSDAKVKIVGAFPEDSHPPIIYPIAVLKEAPNADAAAVLDFLRSDTARAIFEKHGFVHLASTS